MHAKAPVTPPKAAPLTPPKMLPHGKVIPARPQRPSGNVAGPQMGSGAVAPKLGSMGPPPAPSRAAELLEELSKKEPRPGDPAPKERGPDGRGARPNRPSQIRRETGRSWDQHGLFGLINLFDLMRLFGLIPLASLQAAWALGLKATQSCLFCNYTGANIIRCAR